MSLYKWKKHHHIQINYIVVTPGNTQSNGNEHRHLHTVMEMTIKT